MVAAFCWTFSTLIPYSQLIKKHCAVFYNNTVAGVISTDTSNMVQLDSQEAHLSSSYSGVGGCRKGPVFAIRATACMSAAVLLRALFFRVTITAVLPTTPCSYWPTSHLWRISLQDLAPLRWQENSFSFLWPTFSGDFQGRGMGVPNGMVLPLFSPPPFLLLKFSFLTLLSSAPVSSLPSPNPIR